MFKSNRIRAKWNDDEYPDENPVRKIDYGPEPYVTNIEEDTVQNKYFRRALWTGEHLQLTLMSIPVNGEIGLEIHPDTDQFLRIEEGTGITVMGDKEDNLPFRKWVYPGYAVFIPAGTWHNLVNMGRTPIKLYSIYAPPQHPRGTVHRTKEEAEEAEKTAFEINKQNMDDEVSYPRFNMK
ncbi:hypothetical protein SDC9_154885 [bioreactor metagenome]|uniref:Cupin type-2 domain-containing protein n=1 Tax=bioreactor metagenome TaxID=1076179 RepID=A0A645F4S6_9ZZZZ|nr:cupin domain-containing protein [Oscillospiraceae bacterium]